MENIGHERRADTSLARIIPSDMLQPIREIAASIPWMREVGLPVQFRVVVDANVVFDELIWLVGRRRNPKARTALQELAAAGTLLLIAPIWLDDEVREHADESATRAGVSVAKYLLAWEAYREFIRFVRPRGNERIRGIDPDDVAYVSAYQDVAAHAVYSNDHHIAQIGARTVNKEVIITLRDYSRAASWQYALQYGGMTAVVLSWQMLTASLQMLTGIARLVRSSPTWLKLTLLGGAIALIAHPTSRRWLAKKAGRVGSILQMAGSKAGRTALQLGAEAAIKTQQANEALSKMEGHFESRRIPLRVIVLIVCLKEQRPLSLEEIELKAMENGYRTKAKDFRIYLRRVLRESENLVHVQAGWTYAGIPGTP